MAFVSPFNKCILYNRPSSLQKTSPLYRLVTTPHKHSRFPPTYCSAADPERTQVGANQVTGQAADQEARLQLWREVEALKKSLTIAVNAERFSDAARLRDQIKSLSLADDYVRTESDLKKAVEEERFAEAARLRDVLKALEPPPGMASLRAEKKFNLGGVSVAKDFALLDPKEVESWSKTKTRGIVVHIESYYVPEQSVPEHNRFFFKYKVKITNESAETCQLVSRHWIINVPGTPENEVRGPGVVGRQPVLEPGDHFEYTSGCPVTVSLQGGQCVVGSMKGQFHFCRGDTGNIKFSVDIDPFYFKLPFRNFRSSSGPSSPGSSSWPQP